MYSIYHHEHNEEIISHNLDRHDVIHFFQGVVDSAVGEGSELLPTAFKHYVLVVNNKQSAPETFLYATDFTFRRVLIENVHNCLPDCNAFIFGGFNDAMQASEFAHQSYNKLESDKLKAFLR